MKRLAIAVLAYGLVPLAAGAAEEAGRAEYLAACSGCHGATGEGDGALAEVLNVEVPPLTGLAASNGGAFPFAEVFLTIDGRGSVRAHGSAMPIWGDRFSAEALMTEYPETAEYIARGRVLSLVDYLVSIQQE